MIDEDDEFSQFVASRWESLVRTARMLGAEAHEAEDIAQVTLAKAFAVWGRVRRAQKPDAYVARILINSFRASRRRRWWGEVPNEVLAEQAESDKVAEIATRDLVEQALATISPRMREVLVLRYFCDLTESDIAECLGLPPGTVKSRTSRGLAAMQQELTRLGEVIGGTPYA